MNSKLHDLIAPVEEGLKALGSKIAIEAADELRTLADKLAPVLTEDAHELVGGVITKLASIAPVLVPVAPAATEAPVDATPVVDAPAEVPAETAPAADSSAETTPVVGETPAVPAQ